MILHASIIGMLWRCPAQVYFRYELDLKVPPSGAAHRGTSYHRALAENFRQKETTRENLSVSNVRDAFHTAWEEGVRSSMGVDFKDDDPGILKDGGYAAIEAYMRERAGKVQPIKGGTEREFECLIAGIPFAGTIDRIDERKLIIDDKTSSKKWSARQPFEEPQSYIYPLAWQQIVGERPPMIYDVATIYDRKDGIVAKTEVIESTLADEDYRWFTEKALPKTYEQIISGLFPPNPAGWHCSERWCGYYKYCRGGETPPKWI
mgnify:CR=1 FL=1